MSNIAAFSEKYEGTNINWKSKHQRLEMTTYPLLSSISQHVTDQTPSCNDMSDYSWEWAAICLQWSVLIGSTGVYLLWKWKHITHHAHLHRTHCNVASIHIISLPKDNWTDGYSWEPWMRLWCSFYVCVFGPCAPRSKSNIPFVGEDKMLLMQPHY